MQKFSYKYFLFVCQAERVKFRKNNQNAKNLECLIQSSKRVFRTYIFSYSLFLTTLQNNLKS